jgi:hypothetical protein
MTQKQTAMGSTLSICGLEKSSQVLAVWRASIAR